MNKICSSTRVSTTKVKHAFCIFFLISGLPPPGLFPSKCRNFIVKTIPVNAYFFMYFPYFMVHKPICKLLHVSADDIVSFHFGAMLLFLCAYAYQYTTDAFIFRALWLQIYLMHNVKQYHYLPKFSHWYWLSWNNYFLQ